jgi:hypothetical protein
MNMTDMALLDMIERVPVSKRQELYDFAHFLADRYSAPAKSNRIEAFETEDEMVGFINDVGKTVYEN